MKKSALIIFLTLLNSILFSDYDSIGIRDPMVKTMIKKNDAADQKNKGSQNRIREIYKVLKRCRIEGVVISANKKLVLINDRLLAEGDKIMPDCDIYIYKIEGKLIKLSLDSQIVTYSLSASK